MHLRGMEADLHHAHLIFAARRREPGALRALALSLDQQLIGDDVALDGRSGLEGCSGRTASWADGEDFE